MPGMPGNELLAATARGLSARQARPADRLLGHRGDDQRDQRGAPRSLPVEALGSARGAPLPGVDDLLDDWQAESLPEATGLRLVGHQWSPRSHEIKDFLGEQPHPLPLVRRAARSGGAGAARGGRRRRATRCRRCSSRTACVLRNPRAAARRRAPRQAAVSGARRVRPRDRRRRPGRPCGGGLRRLRGAAHAPARPARARRPGRHQLAHRELSRLSRPASAAAS